MQSTSEGIRLSYQQADVLLNSENPCLAFEGSSDQLRATLLSAVTTHAPSELHVVMVDNAESAPPYPHTLDTAQQSVDEVIYVLELACSMRYKSFREHGTNTYEEFDARMCANGTPEESEGRVLAVITDMAALAKDPELFSRFKAVQRDGRHAGIHFLCANVPEDVTFEDVWEVC